MSKNNSNDSTEILIKKALYNFTRLMKSNHDLLVYELSLENDK